MKKLTTEEVIDSFIEIHGSKYNYSHVLYKNMRTKVIIVCPEHGEFEQSVPHHLEGSGCRKCANQVINLNNGKQFSQEKFIEIVSNKNIPNISFEKTIYQGKRKKVTITCSIHNDYTTNAEMLLKGHGCPKCKCSTGEDIVEKILSNLSIIAVKQKGFEGLKFKRSLKFDFYLPIQNACIEFDGEQHFKSVPYWKGEQGFRDLQIKDGMKNLYCKINNIPLLRIRFDNENIERTIKSFLYTIENK